MTDKAEKTEKKSFIKRHKVFTGIVAAIILIAIGTSIGNSNNTTVTNTASNTSSATSSSKKPAATTAKVGDTINIGGSQGLAVTLSQIIDPASGGDQYTTPDAGKRFVAVDVKIVNNGKGSYQDDANNNITLIGSDNQSYTADFDGVSECTNFNDGQYTLTAGESSTGCVVFQVPNGVNPTKVQFQTISGLDSSTGEWLAQ